MGREWEERGKRVGRVGYSKGERVYGLYIVFVLVHNTTLVA